jgi:flagellar hook-associated protein 3 FlgL
MRITGNRLLDRAAAATSASQAKVADKANALTSGLRVQTPSDDPTAWLAAQRASLRKSLSESAGTAMAFGRDRLDETDHAMATILDSVAAVRQLAIQGSNDSYSAASRAELGVQVRALFAGALAAANTRASNGEYLLAGSASLTAPFDATGAYLGDARTRSVPTAETTLSVTTIAGSDLTAARGVDVLPLLGRVATALETDDAPTLRSLLGALQTAIDQVASARTRGGGAMIALDDAARAHAQLQQNLGADIARYVETDAVSAASELAKASQALDASRTVSTHVIALLNRATST